VEALSSKQQAILDFVHDFYRESGYPPSVREIQRACGISSTSVVDYNMRILEQKGLLKRDREVSRGIDMRDDAAPRLFEVPLMGAIAAGAPIPVLEDRQADETVTVLDSLLAGRERVFALRVKGNSMVQDAILDGDIVLIEDRRTAGNGDTVAVWLKDEQETTLKRYYDEGERIRLQPANDAMAPIYVSPENVEVQGRFVGLLRGEFS